MSRQLATAVAGVTAILWIVALRYGNFSRKAQRTYQDALAETNQVGVGARSVLRGRIHLAYALQGPV